MKISKKARKRIYTVCLIVLSLTFVTCLVVLVNYFWQCKKSEDKVDDLKKMVVDDDSAYEEFLENGGGFTATGEAQPEPEFTEVDGKNIQTKYVELYKSNTDFVGWIKIDDTEIDYPVMQTMADEEYYIRRDFDKEYSNAGTLFVDTSSNLSLPSDNIMIYGHNMKTGKMFHDLVKYEEKSFYNGHKFIMFNTIYGDGIYEVIAAFRTKIEAVDYTGFKYYQFFNAASKEEFDAYISNCKALTPYKISATAEYGDTLLTLSTCAYHDDNGRYVVVAKKIN